MGGIDDRGGRGHTTKRFVALARSGRDRLPAQEPHLGEKGFPTRHELETNRGWELPMPFWSETVRRVVAV